MHKMCPFTGSTQSEVVFTYRAPPPLEIRFAGINERGYYREIIRFPVSGHYLSVHDYNLDDLYANDYVEANYKDANGILDKFNKIMSIPVEKSDNRGRVACLHHFASKYFSCDTKEIKLLDVGAGLGVFVAAMIEKNYLCTALDPDQRAVEHIQKNIGASTVCGDFMRQTTRDNYDIITFNKVLEHVKDPIAMLSQARHYLKPHGIIYIELPDGEVAAREGKDREEFCIDHWHVFSFASCAMLAALSGFDVISQERLKEPSTKYTLRAFLKFK